LRTLLTKAATAHAPPLPAEGVLRAPCPPRLVQQLQKDAAQHLGLRVPPAIAHLRSLPNPYSDVHLFELQCAAQPRRLYVKIPHPGQHGRAVARQRLAAESEMLKRLQQRDTPTWSESGYGTVEVLNFYPEYPALATFEAATSTLREHYRSGGRRLFPGAARKSLVAAVTHCGQWLRDFQQATDAGCGPFPVQPLLDYLEIRLQRAVGLPGLGFTEALAQDLRHRVRAVADAIAPGQHRLCGRHNDFASHNILVHGERIWVLDFSMVDTSSSAFDPATFWLDLEMLKADPLYSAPFLGELQQHFLQACGGITPEDPAFTLVRVQYQLNRILTLHTTARLPTPATLYRRAVVRQCMEHVRGFAQA
jgi:hypothetical protein